MKLGGSKGLKIDDLRKKTANETGGLGIRVRDKG